MRYDVTKMEPGNFLGSKQVGKCPKCGRPAIEMEDPLMPDKRVCIHKFERDGSGFINATDRCELDREASTAGSMR